MTYRMARLKTEKKARISDAGARRQYSMTHTHVCPMMSSARRWTNVGALANILSGIRESKPPTATIVLAALGEQEGLFMIVAESLKRASPLVSSSLTTCATTIEAAISASSHVDMHKSLTWRQWEAS